MSVNRFLTVLCCLLAVVSGELVGGLLVTCPAAASEKDDAKLLAENRIQPTAPSVATFLRQFKPDTAIAQKARKLIDQLGDPVFLVRERAVKELVELSEVPLNLLREAAASSDPEIGYRARSILDDPRTAKKLQSAQRRRDVAAAVLRMVRDKPIRKTTSVILEVAPFFDDVKLLESAADAVAAVAEARDIPLLRRSISDENTAVRIAAIRGLAKAVGREAKSELQLLRNDDDPHVVLAIAHALAEQSDRDALRILVELLASADERVRVRSVQILRGLTEQNFALNPYGQVEDQQPQLELWKKWLAGDGGTAPLHVPVVLKPLPEDLSRGLLVHYTFDQDASGKLLDASGHERHATPQNLYELASRGRGKTLRLHGTGHHGDAGGHVILPFIEFSSLQQFTLAMWVRETAMSHYEGEAYITFGTDRGVGTESALGIAHFNANLIFRVGGGEVAVPYPDADRDRWVHYAMTYSDRRLRAYRDGRLIGETSGDVAIQSKRAALGRHWWGDGAGTSARFQGELDDIRVYDRALSRQQVELLTSAVSPAKPTAKQ